MVSCVSLCFCSFSLFFWCQGGLGTQFRCKESWHGRVNEPALCGLCWKLNLILQRTWRLVGTWCSEVFLRCFNSLSKLFPKKAFAGLAFAPKRLRSRSINLYLATWTAITRVSKMRSKRRSGYAHYSGPNIKTASSLANKNLSKHCVLIEGCSHVLRLPPNYCLHVPESRPACISRFSRKKFAEHNPSKHRHLEEVTNCSASKAETTFLQHIARIIGSSKWPFLAFNIRVACPKATREPWQSRWSWSWPLLRFLSKLLLLPQKKSI